MYLLQRCWQATSSLHSLTDTLTFSRRSFPTRSAFLFYSLAGILVVALFPVVSNAAVIAQQNNYDTDYTGASDAAAGNYWGAKGGVIQTISSSTVGSWVTGNLSSVTFQLKADNEDTDTFSVQFIDCGTRNPAADACKYSGLNYTALYNLYPAAYATQPSGVYFAIASTTETYRTYQFVSTTTAISLNPNNYYLLLIFGRDNTGTEALDFKASSVNGYSGGYCARRWTNDPSTVCSGAADIVFSLSTDTTGLQNKIIAIQSPSNQSVTETEDVLFAYTYQNSSLYDRASVILKDQTTGISYNMVQASSTIASSGTHSYSYLLTLISGHLYEWQPVMYDTNNVLPPIYGAKTVFFVETTEDYQSIPFEFAFPVGWDPVLSSGYTGSTSTGLVATTTVGDYTTYTFASTTGLANCFAYLPDALRNALSIKAPWSYICDVQVLIGEMVNGDGNASGDLVLTYPVILGKDLGTTTKLIDKSRISQFEAINTFKQVAGYAMYLATALGIMWAAIRIL